MRFSTVQVGERVYMTEVERVSWETLKFRVQYYLIARGFVRVVSAAIKNYQLKKVCKKFKPNIYQKKIKIL